MGYAYISDKDFSTSLSITVDIDGAAWIEIQLEKSQFVNQIIYYNQFLIGWFGSNDSCVESKEAFLECMEGTSAISVKLLEDGDVEIECDKIVLNRGLSKQDQTYSSGCNADGSSIKLACSKQLKIVELFILGKGMNNSICL